jgi:hypothetical protein
MKFNLSALVLTSLVSLYAANISAAEVCKVSMMGRVCYDDAAASTETSAHMKGDAVAEAKKVEVAGTKTAANDVKK